MTARGATAGLQYRIMVSDDGGDDYDKNTSEVLCNRRPPVTCLISRDYPRTKIGSRPASYMIYRSRCCVIFVPFVMSAATRLPTHPPVLRKATLLTFFSNFFDKSHLGCQQVVITASPRVYTVGRVVDHAGYC